jgi:hypothetical protein
MFLVHPYPRFRDERHALLNAAKRIDAANAKRAAAQVQDQIVRIDYEETMGAALDNLRMLLQAIRYGASLEGFL